MNDWCPPWLKGRMAVSMDNLLFRQNFLNAIAEDFAASGVRCRVVVDDGGGKGIGIINLDRPGYSRLRLELEENRVHLDGYNRRDGRIYQHYDLSDPAWLERATAMIAFGPDSDV